MKKAKKEKMKTWNVIGEELVMLSKLPKEEEIKFLEEVSKKSKEMFAICEEEDFVFDNLKNRWQKLAFTFYAEIVALSSKAEAILADCREALGGELK